MRDTGSLSCLDEVDFCGMTVVVVRDGGNHRVNLVAFEEFNE